MRLLSVAAVPGHHARAVMRVLALAGVAGLAACTMPLTGGERDAPAAAAAPPAVGPAPAAAPPELVQLPALPRPDPRRVAGPQARVVPAAFSPTAAGRPPAPDAAAAAFAAFTATADTLIRDPLRTAARIRAAARALTEPSSEMITRGFSLSVADTLAGMPAFAAAISASGPGPEAARLRARIAADPALVRSLPGADGAAGALQARIAGDITRLEALGAHFRATWTRLQTRADLMPVPKALRLPFTPEAQARVLTRVAILPPGLSARDRLAAQDRLLGLAALLVLGARPGDPDAAALAENPVLGQCLRFAALNLRQCLAAGPTPAEQAFCAGRHGADEPAQCLGWMIGR